MSEDTHSEWEKCKKDLQQTEAWENERLCYQARLEEETKILKFFHAVIKECRQPQLTQLAFTDGNVLKGGRGSQLTDRRGGGSLKPC